MKITDFLEHGRENAIRADVLAARLETTPRGLRSQIMKARDAGEIILYAPGGYGGYNNSPYGGGYGGGTYGSAGGADPYRGNGEGNRSGGSADDEPFSEFGGSGNSSGNRADGGAGGNDDSPFSDIDG